MNAYRLATRILVVPLPIRALWRLAQPVSAATLLIIIAACGGGGEKTTTCGTEGADCCSNSGCNSGLTCTSSGKCAIAQTIECGTSGAACCDNAACNAGLLCESGTCREAQAACGGSAQPCCAGKCNANLSCNAHDVCQAEACTPEMVSRAQSYYGILPATRLGAGLATLGTGTVLDSCVTFVPSSEVPTSGTRNFTYEFAADYAELRTHLSLDANAAWKAGVSAVEASANFYNSQEVNSSNAYLILKVDLAYPAQVATDVRLTDQAVQRLATDPQGFYAQCGDQFIDSFTKGAQFRAIYKFSENSVR